ncbi:MAG: hypothetical protein ABIQ07_07425 [Ginsengibacter sp.]
MSKEDIKKELHLLIDRTDEEVLNMVKEELVAYNTGEKQFDGLSYLSDEDRAELEELVNEDPMKDTISHEEFKQHIAEWRLQLLQKRDLKTK